MSDVERVDDLVLRNLVLNEEFFGKVISFISPEYFLSSSDRKIMELISEHVKKYRSRKSVEALRIDCESLKIREDDIKEIRSRLNMIDSYSGKPLPESSWLIDKAERFCKDRALHNAVMRAISVFEGEDKNLTREDLPSLFSEALSISFDEKIGHDYMKSAEDQYRFYSEELQRIPLDIDMFNKLSKGGLPRKSFTCFMSTRTGGFKTGTMCHIAARAYRAGYNVLYLSAEMSEEMIRSRIDANLMKIKVDDLKTLTRDSYLSKVNLIDQATPGKLKIKEYPTSSAHVGHIRFLLKELKLKEGFVPDMIVLDYINIFTSQKMAGNKSANSYTTVKSTAEEFRGLAVETNAAVVTATQSGRQGVGADDSIDVDDVSESYGIPQTADIMIAVIDNADLESKNMIKYKQMKNRFGITSVDQTFLVGCDKSMMTLFNINSHPGKEFIPPSSRKGTAAEKDEPRSRQSFSDWES